jgi:hypothetical protein
MTRFVFDQQKEFERWISENATPDKYGVYISRDREILMYPLKTSRPLTYAYYKATDDKEVQGFKERFMVAGFRVYEVKDIEWADDRPVGVKFTVSEE